MSLAGMGWAVAALNVLDVITLEDAESNFALGAAMTLTAGLMLCVRRRPIGQAYDMGYAIGRRDAIRAASCRPGSVIKLERHVIEPLPEWDRV